MEFHSRSIQDCLYKWKFEPAKVGNQNVSSEVFLRIDFNKARNPYIKNNYIYRAYTGDNLHEVID